MSRMAEKCPSLVGANAFWVKKELSQVAILWFSLHRVWVFWAPDALPDLDTPWEVDC
jgi:hypothetical protein